MAVELGTSPSSVEVLGDFAKLMPPVVLSEEVLFTQGCWKRVIRYLLGHYPERGSLHQGWRGAETIQVRDVITPVRTFYVKPLENSLRETI